jgi:hypothetical protein
MSIVRPRTSVLLAFGLAAALVLSLLATADASSHREAPLIAGDPLADNTDFYAFVSPANADNVTFVSNFVPLQNPAGGPNFFFFGDDVLYEIHVDTTGDSVPNLSYEFRFNTAIQDGNTFLAAGGPIETLGDENHNLFQTYSVAEVRDGVRTVLGQNIPVPPSNIGFRSTPEYEQLAQQAVTSLPNGLNVFAGQRNDVFQFDAGAVFDLGGLRPLNSAHVVPGPEEPASNAFFNFNVQSIAIEVPRDRLGGVGPDNSIIGAYSTASRRTTRVFTPAGPVPAGGNPVHNGEFVQVSRLGMPLVNEVVVPLKLKDAFNALDPRDDAAVFTNTELANAGEPGSGDPGTMGPIPLVTDPILAQLIPSIYPGAFECEPTRGERSDLVSIFLTGIQIGDTNLNRNVGEDVAGSQPSEMLRLNHAIAPSDRNPNDNDRLGLLAGEFDGFPNGRRLSDDSIDISLRAVMGGTPLGDCADVAPNNALTQGLTPATKPTLLTEFPYIPTPLSGYDDPNGVRE